MRGREPASVISRYAGCRTLRAELALPRHPQVSWDRTLATKTAERTGMVQALGLVENVGVTWTPERDLFLMRIK